jgi:twinkle protein
MNDKKAKPAYPIDDPEFKPIRGISQRTMEKMKYGIAEYHGDRAQMVYVPFANGKGRAATKIRLPQKKFRFEGNTTDAGLVFQNLYPGNGKKVVITEGEIDALSVAEAQGTQWPVVSIPNGVDSAKKSCSKPEVYKWLNGFDEIVVWFDEDEVGQQAAEDVARLFSGKTKVVKTLDGFKDANDMLKAGKIKEITNCIWRAEKYTPARFVTFGSLKEEVLKPVEMGMPWIFDEMTQWTYGRRRGESYFFGAGTGVGKTDFCMQQGAADIAAGEKVAVFQFEQTPKETALRFAGKHAQKRLHVPDGSWTTDELTAAFDELEKAGAYIYNHEGQAEWETVEEDITMLANMGYRHFWIDNISAFAAGAVEERTLIDGMVKDIAQLCQKLLINCYVISHLATPEGKSHEEGGHVAIRHFKGSRSIGAFAYFMFGFERDTQSEDPEVKARTKLKCLKDRYTGDGGGKFLTMLYDPKTGMQSVDSDWSWDKDKNKKQAEGFGFGNQSQEDDF